MVLCLELAPRKLVESQALLQTRLRLNFWHAPFPARYRGKTAGQLPLVLAAVVRQTATQVAAQVLPALPQQEAHRQMLQPAGVAAGVYRQRQRHIMVATVAQILSSVCFPLAAGNQASPTVAAQQPPQHARQQAS